jgi:NADPH:quinone reductase-like Zn-dependent oxidoreductase
MLCIAPPHTKLTTGETMLVNGATGTAARLAVQLAKHLGAQKVIAPARNADALTSVAALGADVRISLDENEAAPEGRLKEQFAEGIDVVID